MQAEMSLDYSKLQNGSDIRGIVIEGDDGKKPNLGYGETLRLTYAFASWLSLRTGKDINQLKISIGHDSRITAPDLKGAIFDALLPMGVKVLDCGLASTPAMFMSTVFKEFECDGAIMITASHLPYNRNGFKYFTEDGGLEKMDISRIIAAAQRAEKLEAELKFISGTENTPLSADLMEAYSKHLAQKIIKEVNHPETYDKPLAGLKIVVDAGNGAGGFYVDKILKPLGADVTGSQFLEPDGYFPNHAPNPEDSQAMDSISKAVIENRADLGIIFDTDVDRSSAVDRSGKEINRNAIVAMAAALIAKEHPGTTVVTDSITSDQLTVYLEQCLGLKHLRYKRGYRNVINKSIELNRLGQDSQLAIETSGHAAYKENYFLDDGAYLATKIVIKAAQMKLAGGDLAEILSGLEEPVEAIEKRYAINRENFGAYAEEILEDLKRWCGDEPGETIGAQLVEPNYEGVRINFKNQDVEGWCLLRKSLHDPKMPLNIEVTRGSCQTILGYMDNFLRGYDVE